jgi:Na+-driven multidrug efflux pump
MPQKPFAVLGSGVAIMGSYAIGKNQNRVPKHSSSALYIVMTVGSILGLIYLYVVR